MRGSVDFLLQDLLGTGDGQLGNTFTQLLLGTFDFLVNLGLGTGDNLVRLNLGLTLGLFDDLLGTLFSGSDHLGGLFLGFTQGFGGTLGSDLLLLLAALGGREAISNLLLAVGHRLLQRRPDKLHRDPDEDREPDRLTNQSSVDIHARLLSVRDRAIT